MSDDGTAPKRRVLVVDDEQDLAESCAFFLRRAGHDVDVVFSGERALELMDEHVYALVVTDLKMPRMSGLQLLEAIKERAPDVEVVLITGFPEVETAVEAMRNGALDYVTKPFKEEQLMSCVEKAFAHHDVVAKRGPDRLRPGTDGTAMTAVSSVFRETLATVERAARTDASVLVQGESGTGKELVARHLHEHSARAGRPFVPVDCATMPESLVESELFGHVKGAFSGADASKMGLFQVADGGTLFLDEIGELPPSFQTKLLRAIQERQIRRVGGNDWIAVDVRIVAATNRNLEREVEEGRFRADLFYRLDVVRIDLPALRDRVEDVAPLAERFLEQFVAENPSCTVRGFSNDALAALEAFGWPGNVRQLKNLVERACTLGTGERIEVDDLPDMAPIADALDSGEVTEPFQEMKARKLAAIESSYLIKLLRRHKGNVTRCAAEAGMTRSAFQKIMQRYDIRSRDYRTED